MRTTLTIEPVIAQQIRKRMKERKVTLKQVINDTLREGLRSQSANGRPAYKFKVRPHALGLLPGIDPNKLNQLASQLEDEAILEKMRRYENDHS
jgi:hypothetical protein